MANGLGSFGNEGSIGRTTKTAPMLLRVMVLFFMALLGIYTCLVRLRQFVGQPTEVSPVTDQVVERPCESFHIEPSEQMYLHFPKPRTFSRDECACNPVRYFAILSTQRSGSGWFETLLNSHPNITSNGEIFSVKPRRSNVSTLFETLNQVYNLDMRTSASKNECNAALGLKWMVNQGLMQHHEEIAEYFKKRGVSVIFLFRRNLLRRLISILANTYDHDIKPLNGTHKSHVHSTDEAEVLASFKPAINTATLIDDLKQVDQLVINSLKYFNGTRHIILYYEDIVKNRTKLVDIQDFLKVPHTELTSQQVKIHKGPVSSQIENWDEVNNALQGTQYESFLLQDY